MTDHRIKKAVFPVAGLGTRFLPATKASPKEMLPIVDRPLIQYAVDEAVAAGAETLIFITGRTKRAIEDHFDKAYELEAELEQKQKYEMLELVRSTVPDGVHCIYIRQGEALGLGHAVYCARAVIGDEPFSVLLADDLIDGNGQAVLCQMAEQYAEHHNSVLGVERVPREETHKYGVVSAEPVTDDLFAVNSIVEKPAPEEAPSNLAVVGRYILTPGIFDELAQTAPDAKGEIQLTDAIASLLKKERVLVHEFSGRRYDCGSKLGYLEAMLDYGLKHPELGPAFRDYVKSRFG